MEWLTAVVTPVPKNTRSEIVSRLAEKLVVRHWFRPALPNSLLEDQFGLRHGSLLTFWRFTNRIIIIIIIIIIITSYWQHVPFN